MKQSEIAKIKNQFKISSKRLTVERFAVGIVEAKELKLFKILKFSTMESAEQIVYMKLLKESLGGKVGKALLEYSVPHKNFSNGSGIQKLYNLSTAGLVDETAVQELIKDLAEKSLYDNPICITIGDVYYNVPVKKEDAMDDDDDASDEDVVFHFLVCNITPLEMAEAELYYNEKQSALMRRKDDGGFLVLGSKATDSIMYPVLNDGAGDVNYVLYRTKDPKNPNRTIVEEFLKCEYTMSGIDEQERIKTALYGTFGSEVDYNVLVGLKSELKKIERDDEENPEVTKVNSQDLSLSLENLGCAENTVARFESKYNEAVGEDVSIKTVNVLNSDSTTFKTGNIKVVAKQSEIDKVSIREVGGKTCIVVEIDETLTVDDFIVKV